MTNFEKQPQTAPPELPASIRALFRYKKGSLEPLKDSAAKAFLQGKPTKEGAVRPTLDRERFASYWETPQEAAIAWEIRQILIDTMDRPEEMMVFPDDPMALLDFWRNDSLEDVEFIIALEKHFKISIPDAEAEKLFLTFTMREAVRFIQRKNEGEPQAND